MGRRRSRPLFLKMGKPTAARKSGQCRLSACPRRFYEANIRDTPVGRRTSERVKIEQVYDRDFPLIYASDLAEQRIKHEIREADDNLFKKGFIVDVNEETMGGRSVAYRVMRA